MAEKKCDSEFDRYGDLPRIRGKFNKIYTEEQEEFLKQQAESLTIKELTKAFNDKFGMNKSSVAIGSKVRIVSGVHYVRKLYTKEEDQLLLECFVNGLSTVEIAKAFSRKSDKGLRIKKRSPASISGRISRIRQHTNELLASRGLTQTAISRKTPEEIVALLEQSKEVDDFDGLDDDDF